MKSLDVAVHFFERFMDIIGLSSPTTRLIGLGSMGFVYQLIMKPSISYGIRQDEHGNIVQFKKPIKFFSTALPENTTYFPWFMWSLLPMLIGGLFL